MGTMDFIEQLSAVTLLIVFLFGVTFGMIGGAVHGGLFKTLDCESLAGFRSLCRRAFALIAANRTTASGDGTFPLSAWAQAGKMSGRMSFLRFELLI
jgi:hypothetical protein